MSGRIEDAALAQKIEREVTLLRPTRLTPGSVRWGGGPDHASLWIPEDLVPLWDTAEYAALAADQRRRYNQYYALQKTEQFVWFERFLLLEPLEALLKSGDSISPALRTLLESFVADERQHNASLVHLLRLSRPDLYARGDFFFFTPPAAFRLIARIMALLPRLLSSWMLFVGTLEEQTITISQKYREKAETVDPLFAEVYMLHAQDEARHCKLDTILAECFVARQTGWRKRVNAFALGLAFQNYFGTDWGYEAPIERLVVDFPELTAQESMLVKRAGDSRSPEFAKILIDGELAPITAKNAERFEMLERAVHRLIPAARP